MNGWKTTFTIITITYLRDIFGTKQNIPSALFLMGKMLHLTCSTPVTFLHWWFLVTSSSVRLYITLSVLWCLYSYFISNTVILRWRNYIQIYNQKQEFNFKVFNEISLKRTPHKKIQLWSKYSNYGIYFVMRTDDLFFFCPYSNTFWYEMYDWLESYLTVKSHFHFRYHHIWNNNEGQNYKLLSITLSIVGKFFTKTQPLFTVFSKDFTLFYKSMLFMEKKTKKLLNLIDVLKLTKAL